MPNFSLRRPSRDFVLFAVMWFVCVSSQADVYKCTVAGKVIYQDSPCAVSHPQPAAKPYGKAGRERTQREADEKYAAQARRRAEIETGFVESSSASSPQKTAAVVEPTALAVQPPRLLRTVAVDRMTTYISVLGRGVACGWSNASETSRRVGAWMDREGLTAEYALVASEGIKLSALQQRAAVTPDSCTKVLARIDAFPWP
jgi:Domain of unknown function (DUF4124)